MVVTNHAPRSTMTVTDPRDVIRERLCAPAGVLTVTGEAADGWRSGFVTGGPPSSAKPESVKFITERHGTNHVLFAVTYTDNAGLEHLDIAGVRQQPDGSWIDSGSAGGSGSSPDRDRPWINLAGWWTDELLCAGGEVSGRGSEHARRVRLTFEDGTNVEDEIEQRVALFLVEHAVQLPAVADLLAADGDVLNTHTVLG